MPDAHPDVLPPHHLDAEAAVLGSCLLDREAIGRLVDWLFPSDFYGLQNGTVYAAMVRLYQTGSPVDYLTLTAELERTGSLDTAGGVTALSGLLAAVPTPIHVEHYGKLVADAATARRVIAAGGRIAQLGYRPPEDPEQLFIEAERLMHDARGTTHDRQVRPFLSVLSDYLDEIAALHRDGSASGQVGVGSGWIDFDQLTQGGLQKGNLAVLAGRPGLGKTAVSLAIGVHAAAKQRVPVLLFSIEMTRAEIAARIVAAESRLSAHHVRAETLTSLEERQLGEAVGRIAEIPLWIDDSPSQTLGSICARTRRLGQQTRLGLVVVDHLQLVTSGRSAENRNQEVAEISRGLKALAREIAAPVLVVSQLNRSVESRTNKRPLLSDLRDSGAVEQDADLVVLLYRDDYYNPESDAANIAELHVAKQRNGPTGLVSLYFDRVLGRFLDLNLWHGSTAVLGIADDD